jgi:hypothetical protein
MRNVSAYWSDWVVRQKVSRYQLGDMRKLSDSLPYLGGYAESLHILIVRPLVHLLGCNRRLSVSCKTEAWLGVW